MKNKMIYPVRMHSYLFLFWATLQVCSINLEYLLSSIHIQNPASWIQDWRTGSRAGTVVGRTGPLKWEEVSEEDLRCSREGVGGSIGVGQFLSWRSEAIHKTVLPRPGHMVRGNSQGIAVDQDFATNPPLNTTPVGFSVTIFIWSKTCAFWQSQAPTTPLHPRPHHAWGVKWRVLLDPVWAGRLWMLCPWGSRPAAQYLQVCCTGRTLLVFEGVELWVR